MDEIHRRMGGQLNVALFDKTASNPAAHIGAAIALFCERAPDVALNLHIAPINAIERGVIDGQFQVGVIPGHRSSDSLTYDALFNETMLLYCGAQHTLFGTDNDRLAWSDLGAHQFAGLGYHSPNMEISQQVRLPRKATAFDQEAIATLILSGKFLGFLPDHYADSFVRLGQLADDGLYELGVLAGLPSDWDPVDHGIASLDRPVVKPHHDHDRGRRFGSAVAGVVHPAEQFPGRGGVTAC